MTTKWNKYTYINTDTDALIEITKISGSEEQLLNPLNNGPYVLLSVEDATIHPNNERKEMQSTEYNSNLLVTYKKIEDGIVSYPTIKVTELEYQLDRVQSLVRTINKHDSLISNLEENIVEWYNPNYDKDEVLSALCELIGYTPVKKVRVTGQVYVEVDLEVPLDEVEGFDGQQLLNDYLVVDYVDNGTVNSHYVEDVDVEW
jgi:hypothetical protein